MDKNDIREINREKFLEIVRMLISMAKFGIKTNGPLILPGTYCACTTGWRGDLESLHLLVEKGMEVGFSHIEFILLEVSQKVLDEEVLVYDYNDSRCGDSVDACKATKFDNDFVVWRGSRNE